MKKLIIASCLVSSLMVCSGYANQQPTGSCWESCDSMTNCNTCINNLGISKCKKVKGNATCDTVCAKPQKNLKDKKTSVPNTVTCQIACGNYCNGQTGTGNKKTNN